MSAGRKRVPDNLKVIRGTDQPCRMRPDAPDPVEDMPRPPGWLSRRGCEHFGALRERLNGVRLATATDTEMLAMAASRLAEIEELSAFIDEHGIIQHTTNTKGDPVIKHNPAVQQRNEAMRHLQSLLAEFGLSPASRGKVSAPKKDQKESNPFANLG